MPISGDQCLDRNDPDFGLPLDTCCVGDGGPSPEEARLISKSKDKSPAQSSDVSGSYTTGYDGP